MRLTARQLPAALPITLAPRALAPVGEGSAP